MVLTKQDLQAIRTVIKEETEPKFEAISKRFDDVDKAIENVAQELVNFAGELHQDHEVRIRRIEQQTRS